ncbi:porin [Caldimonas sp. KR1-144]|uniref:porin n=1 Tax=Caldimonas sp. KR1-144 TaxID=3400911 RepID=UPI003C0D00D7
MKRIALAAALAAAFTGSAFAQSSVTLYGRINTTVEARKFSSADDEVYGMFNNASRWGLRGTEDLGGGLKAFFQLESGFGSDNGSGTGGFSRDAYVGLNSASLGQVKLGKFNTFGYYATVDYIGNFNHNTGLTSEDNLYGLAVTLNNAVEYVTPTFGGFTGSATVAAGEGSATQTKFYEVAGAYDMGALHLGAAWNKAEILGQDVVKGFTLGAWYAFGPFGVGASFDQADRPVLGKRDHVALTGMYTMGNSEFHLSYGWADEWDNAADTDAQQITLGYNYNLSKRTKVYAFFFKTNTGAAATDYGDPGEDIRSLGFGIRHNF